MSERIICLGDSITEGIGDGLGIGWVGRLNNALNDTNSGLYHVMNLGVAGDTSLDIHHRLLNEALYRAPSLLIIAAGLNDVTQRVWPEATGHKVNMNYSKDVWMKTFSVLKTSGIRTVFVGLTPVNEEKLPLVFMPYDNQDKGHDCANDDVISYNTMLRNLVEKSGFTYIDIFEKLKSVGYIKTAEDGLHPNAQGYDMIFTLVYNELKKQKVWDL